MCVSRATLLFAVLLCGSALAQPKPARVGDDRPLTSRWLCENDRSVLLNAHPRRRAEEASLTYAGTRVAVKRVPAASGVAFEGDEGKVKWHEKGDEAQLEFAPLLKEAVLCRRQSSRR